MNVLCRSSHLLCLLALLTQFACTHEIVPTPAPISAKLAQLPLTARYFVSAQVKGYTDSDSYAALGPAHTWNIHVGEALVNSFPQMLGTVFRTVEPASSATDLGTADVLIVPQIVLFAVSGGDFVSELEISVQAKGKDRVVRLHQSFVAAPTEGMAGSAWMGSAFAGGSVLKESAQNAFEDVLPKIAVKVRAAFSGGKAKVAARNQRSGRWWL